MTIEQPIHYRDCYVAFLDVLGFESLVKSNTSQSNAKLNDYLRLTNEAIEELKHIPTKQDIGALVISDSIILSIEKGEDVTTNIRILRQLCIAVKKIQYSLALNGLWLRGGISSGDAFFSTSLNQIIGPAYVDAYNLEKNVALYPRVVVDPKIIRQIQKKSAAELIYTVNHHSFEGTNADENVLFPWGNGGVETWDGFEFTHAAFTKDNSLFIDYLSTAFVDLGDLKRIVDNVNEGIYMDSRAYSKYRWVIGYLMVKVDQDMRIRRSKKEFRSDEEFNEIQNERYRLEGL